MNLNVESELHRMFKAAAAREGRKMTDVLTDFIKAYVRQRKETKR